MVLQQQIEALIDYLESHGEMALAGFGRSKEGRAQSRKLWNELALIVNTKGPNPVIKTGDEWRLYYNEYKYKCLRKIKLLTEEHNASGPAKRIILTPTQNRLYNILTPTQNRLNTILGPDAQESLPVGQHVKKSHSQDRLHTILGHAQEPLPVGEDVKTSQNSLRTILGRDAQEPLPVGEDVKKTQERPRIEHKRISILGLNRLEPLPCVRMDPFFHEESLSTSQCHEDSIDITTPPLRSPTTSPPPASSPTASPPLASSPPASSLPASSPRPESAEDRLVRVKQMKTEAILAQARATERLAAAIERGIERLNQPLVIVLRPSPKKRKRRGPVEASDSESE